MRIISFPVALLALLVVALAGCIGSRAPKKDASLIGLATQAPVPSDETPPPCAAALIEGQLVADAESGLGIIDSDGNKRHVVWPYGYSGHDDGSGIVLLDPSLQEVARTGDSVRLGGGEWGSDSWRVCELVERLGG